MQEGVHGWRLGGGAALAPQGMAGFSMGIFGPKLVARLGARRLVTLAGAIAATGFLMLTGLPGSGYRPLLLVVVLVGFGSAGAAFGSLLIATPELGGGDQGLAGGVV